MSKCEICDNYKAVEYNFLGVMNIRTCDKHRSELDAYLQEHHLDDFNKLQRAIAQGKIYETALEGGIRHSQDFNIVLTKCLITADEYTQLTSKLQRKIMKKLQEMVSAVAADDDSKDE